VTLGIPLGYLGCPRCTPTEEALPPKGGVRKVIGFQMYKHVQNMNEIQRDSKRFKEIQREHNISDISDI
jgi:hypothetical protein